MAGEAAWQTIASQKRAYRNSQLNRGVSISVPKDLLPKDPPKAEHGPQSVIDIPRKLLSASEIEITNLSVSSILSKIRTGNLSAEEVTTAFCKRASIAQQLTNCLTEPLFDNAIERAKELDAYYQRKGKTIGPLHGLPISIKDGFNVKGVDSSIGLAALCFKPAETNAPLVELLLSLGCVFVAKTNIPQTLGSLDSINNVFGRTMNPINRLCTAGGSSGGEGVLVAMNGCALGIGTDIGGSIRVPAMCNGVYGFKPSVGRVPYGGQSLTGPEGMSRTSVQATAGPIARSMEDIDIFLREVVPRASMFGEDCITTSSWSVPRLFPFHRHQSSISKGSGPQSEFTIGILRSDGNCQLLPPIANLMDEISSLLSNSSARLNLKVIDIPTPKAWTKSQSVMAKLMAVDGGSYMSQLLLSTKEPLVPWLETRFKHGGKPQPLTRVADLQAQRAQLQHDMAQALWYKTDKHGRRARYLDAVLCPVAPHPVPEIDRYNAVGYTSSWVLMDYPAGTVPVRKVTKDDLQLGKEFDMKPVFGSWDERNRELWDEKLTDRKVYEGTPLCVQVVTQTLEDEKLAWTMKLVDWVVKRSQEPTSNGRGWKGMGATRSSRL